MKKLKSLGSSTTEYTYDAPDFSLLEYFNSPFQNVEPSVHIEASEFSSLCPITGQPDFAIIVIDYIPDKRCVESKSLKLYLGGFRMHGEFHESCVNRIANDLIKLLNPKELIVEGRFTPRGGIPFWPKAVYRSKK